MRNKIERDLLISELIYKHFRGELSAEEEEILTSWLSNPENEAFFLSLRDSDRLYQKMMYVQEVDTEAHFRKLQEKIDHQKQLRRLPWWIGAAALLAISVGVWWMVDIEPVVEPGFQMAREFPLEDQTVLHTPQGDVVYLADSVNKLVPEMLKKKALEPMVAAQPAAVKYNLLATSSRGKIEVMLSDSSRVWLNAGSELKYPDVFGQDRREVYLKGEAYFEVSKNPARPFVVHTGAHNIEVLGTQFNVKAIDRESCVTTLVEGCVRMRNRRNDTVVLRPGQQAESWQGGDMRVREVDLRYDIAWKKDQFGFREATLFHIMEELSEWYGFTFEIRNLRLANQIYTAIMPRFQTADDVLQLLQRTEDFVYLEDTVGKHIVIREK